jgi:hypothetical protein
MGSLHYGPLLLVGLSSGDYALNADVESIGSWLTPQAPTPDNSSFTFKAQGADGKSFVLLPLNQVPTTVLNTSSSAVRLLVRLEGLCVLDRRAQGGGRGGGGTVACVL